MYILRTQPLIYGAELYPKGHMHASPFRIFFESKFVLLFQATNQTSYGHNLLIAARLKILIGYTKTPPYSSLNALFDFPKASSKTMIYPQNEAILPLLTQTPPRIRIKPRHPISHSSLPEMREHFYMERLASCI